MEKNRNLLVVDDEPNIIESIKRFLRKEDYAIFTANSADEALEILKTYDIAVILSDLMMPGTDGLMLFKKMGSRFDPAVKILMTGQGTLKTALEAINKYRLFGYMTKPWPADEIRNILKKGFEHYDLVTDNKRYQELIVEKNNELETINEKLEEKVRNRTAQIENALKEGVMMLAKAAETKDKETGNHLLRIRIMVKQMCGSLGIQREKSETISLFSVIHDVGKIHIPDHILNKQGPLDDDEWAIMKAHTTAGFDILGCKKYYAIAREIARSHHENWDGSGYPDGLKKRKIPLAARIVAIADVYDALKSKRPYKDGWDDERTLNEMKQLSGIKFDPDILNAFFELHEKGHFSFDDYE